MTETATEILNDKLADAAYCTAMQRLQQAGFLLLTAQSLNAACQQHVRLMLLLQADAHKYPEVADSWVIVPELAKAFPALTAAVASYADSEILARQYRLLKFPSLLFFQQQRMSGCISGLLPWQDYLQAVGDYASRPLVQSIPLADSVL